MVRSPPRPIRGASSDVRPERRVCENSHRVAYNVRICPILVSNPSPDQLRCHPPQAIVADGRLPAGRTDDSARRAGSAGGVCNGGDSQSTSRLLSGCRCCSTGGRSTPHSPCGRPCGFRLRRMDPCSGLRRRRLDRVCRAGLPRLARHQRPELGRVWRRFRPVAR